MPGVHRRARRRALVRASLTTTSRRLASRPRLEELERRLAPATVLPALTLSGTVSSDLNSNGSIDTGEPGLAGRLVFLDLNANGLVDSGEPSAATDATGLYSFADLTPGTYTIRLDPHSPGLIVTAPADGARVVTLTDSDGTGQDFAVFAFNPAMPVPANPDIHQDTGTDQDLAFVRALYRAVLGRTATGVHPEGTGSRYAGKPEAQYWTDRLQEGMTREQVAAGFFNSPEYRQQQVTSYYRTFLHRDANLDPLAQYWVGALGSGQGEAAVVTSIVTSTEYTGMHTDAAAFTRDLYFEVLGRTPSNDEADKGSARMAAGMSRSDLALEMLHSQEASAQAVTSFYAAWLNRATDAATQVWTDRLSGGAATLAQVAASVMGSREFYRLATGVEIRVDLSGPVSFPIGWTTTSVATGDFNSDGKLDLAVGNYGLNTKGPHVGLSVLLNTTAAGATTPSFAPPQDFNAGGSYFNTGALGHVVVSDFNSDGKPDVAIPHMNGVDVLLNTTAAGADTVSFAPGLTFSLGEPNFSRGASSVAVGDFNGDGKPDLVAAAKGAVLVNTTTAGASTPSFAPEQHVQTGTENLRSVFVGDFNGDGLSDLVVPDLPGLSVFLSTLAGGTLAFAPGQVFDTGHSSASLAVGDFNGDGKPDIAFPLSSTEDTVSILLNTTAKGAGTVSFASRQDFAAETPCSSVTTGDFDGDGRLDLVLGREDDRGLSVFVNDTTVGAIAAVFTPSLTLQASRESDTSPVTGDFTGDGLIDLAELGYPPFSVSVYVNRT